MLHCQITGNIPSQWTKTNSVKAVCPSLAYSRDSDVAPQLKQQQR